MSRCEQLRIRLDKLQDQITKSKADEIKGPTGISVFSDGSFDEGDLPLITCPACGEITELSLENQLDHEHRRWIYLEDICPACGTHFRVGEISERCALCQSPLRSVPYWDVNELNHHWCKKDGKVYCTACFMQLFFDGHIDVSSDNAEIGTEDPLSYRNVEVGYSVDPYRSRLATRGYEEVATVTKWTEVAQLCRRIVTEGHRYLILSTSDDDFANHQHIVYRTSANGQMGLAACTT